MKTIQWVNQTAHTGLLYVLLLVFFTFPISNALANVAMLLALMLWVSSGQWEQKWHRIKTNPGLWFALGLYAWMWVGIIYTDASSAEIGEHLRKYLKLGLMAVVVTTLADDTWRRRAWTAYGVAMVFTLASAYTNIFVQLPWSNINPQSWGTDKTVFKDHIAQGILVSMMLAIAMANIFKQPRTWNRTTGFWMLIAALCVLSITHLSTGRSAYLTLVAVLAGYVFWSNTGLKRWLGLMLISAAVGGLYSTSSLMQQRVGLAVQEFKNHNLEDFSSMGQRVYFANKSLELIAEKPLLGWGTGAYHQQFCRVADNEKWCLHGKVHPHNQFLFVWVEHGVVGLALLLGMILVPMWMTRNAPAHVRGLAAAYSGIFVVISMTHGSLWLSTESHFHTLMGALIFAGYKPKPKLAPTT